VSLDHQKALVFLRGFNLEDRNVEEIKDSGWIDEKKKALLRSS
jgi:hypothetical protein